MGTGRGRRIWALAGLAAAGWTGAATAQAAVPVIAIPAPIVAPVPVALAAPAWLVTVAPPAPIAGAVVVQIAPPVQDGIPGAAEPTKAPAAAVARSVPVGWSRQEDEDARIRGLQTMIMVGALRCRASGTDVLADYNSFVAAARDTLEGANGELRARFVATYGKADGEDAFDRFTTALANGYGAGPSGAGDCASLSGVARIAAAGGASRAVLLAIAGEQHVAAGLPALDRPVLVAAR